MKQENRIKKDYEELTLTDDFMFCKVLENTPSLAKELLELLLNIKIRKIEVQKQKTIDTTFDAKGIRFDVYAEDDNNSVYDIEMQTTRPKRLAKRSRFYQSILDSNLLDRGDDYRKLRKSYIIFICLSDPFADNRCIYTFENICRENKNLLLEDKTQKIFVNTKGDTEGISEKLKNFIKYLEHTSVNDAFTKKLDEKVCVARTNKDWRRDYMLMSVKYQDAIIQGKDDERRNVIRNALNNGMSKEEISKFLGYTKEEIAETIEELRQPTES